MILVYPIGITTLYAFLLFRRRADIKNKDRYNDDSLNSIAFLWEAYEPNVSKGSGGGGHFSCVLRT